MFLHPTHTHTENITTNLENALSGDDNPSPFLSDFLNISKNEPELIEYYDLDEITTVPEIIYPDPDAMFNSKKKENLKTASKELESEVTDGISEIDWHHNDQRQQIETKQRDAFNGAGGGNSGAGYQNTFNREDLKNEDLREHDIIDNIMYIYYGSSVALRKSLGGSIIIFGTVFALAAQILAVIFTLLRNRFVLCVHHCIMVLQ